MDIIGFPSIGANLELKTLIESYRTNRIDINEFVDKISRLRESIFKYQENLYFVVVNDFSLCDSMFDLSNMLGIIPKEYKDMDHLEQYFAIVGDGDDLKHDNIARWFNTKYYYAIPILSEDNTYKVEPTKIVCDYMHASKMGYTPKISLIGFFTYFSLAKTKQNIDKNQFFYKVKNAYLELVKSVSILNDKVKIEFSEPIFTQDIDIDFNEVKDFYNTISSYGVRAVVTTFFGASNKLTKVLCDSEIEGIGLDFVYGEDNIDSLQYIAKSGKKLYAGVIDGLNIWAINVDSALMQLERISSVVPKDLIYLRPSCSLLHIPITTENESKDSIIPTWLSFAKEKIAELELLNSIFKHGVVDKNRKEYDEQRQKFNAHQYSTIIHNYPIKYKLSKTSVDEVQKIIDSKLASICLKKNEKLTNYSESILNIFLQYNNDEISKEMCINILSKTIRSFMEIMQGIDEAFIFEGLSFMQIAEFIAMQLNGIFVTQNAFIQSYGINYIKPLIIYGDIDVKNLNIATLANMIKNILKGACNIKLLNQDALINYSFLRNDISTSKIYDQLSLYLYEEIKLLESYNIFDIDIYSC